MKTASGWLFAALVITGCMDRAPGSDALAGQDGWVALFDGRTLDGWVLANGSATFVVEDGTLVGRTAEGSPNSFLVTEEHFGNFELEFEVLVDDALNSGVQIRSRTRQEATGEGRNEQAGRVYGPQVEIEASGAEGAESGYIYGEATGHGWLTPPDRLIPRKVFKDGEWNHYRVIADGPRIQTFINGEPVEDLTHEEIFQTHPEGFIGLQVHSIRPGTGPYEVRWRNLRIRELRT
jgi:hypothetical protein